MNTPIHKLQELSVPLLRKLYEQRDLAITNAMRTALNKYCPSIKDILETLDCYKDDPLVMLFVADHEAIIADAKNPPPEAPKKDDQIADENDIFGFPSMGKRLYPYDCMKEVSLGKIEERLSVALSDVCGEELIVIIDSIKSEFSAPHSYAELSIRIKAGSWYCRPKEDKKRGQEDTNPEGADTNEWTAPDKATPNGKTGLDS
jgi:hypothetical protein